MRLLGFDLETYPIGPQRAPKVVCGAFNIHKAVAEIYAVKTWAEKMKDLDDEREVYFFHATSLKQFVLLCKAHDKVFAHNGAFDWSCISAYDPSLIKDIYEMFRNRQLECTYIRSLMLLNAKGDLNKRKNSKIKLTHGHYGENSYVGSVYVHLYRDISELKDHDIQITYYRVEGLPFSQWGEGYVKYLVQDVEHLVDLFLAQESKRYVTDKLNAHSYLDAFKSSPRRSCFHYALTMASAWGVRIDPERVANLRTYVEGEVAKLVQRMLKAGLATERTGRDLERAIEQGKLTVKEDKKAIAELIKVRYEEQGKEVPMTSKGNVSTNRRALVDSDDPLLKDWAGVGGARTIWSTFVPALEKSFETHNVLNPYFFPYLETGRVSANNPNLLNPPREGGVRDCVVARDGCVLIFCDYEGNELRVLAQVLLDMLGSSSLASFYDEDPFFDPHTYMACQRLGFSYEEGKKRKANKDKEFKKVRQLMKACNFGFPGGMASRTFIEFAKGYNLRLNEREAEELKTFFFTQFPEIKLYLNKIGKMVKKGGQGYQRRSGTLTGGRAYCQLANFYFQSLAAEGGLTAFALVSQKAYSDPSSVLYGSRPVLFVHDEIILEAPIEKAHECALELQRIMETSMRIFTPDIPSVAEPALATKWWKDAYPKYDEGGRLIASDLGEDS